MTLSHSIQRRKEKKPFEIFSTAAADIESSHGITDLRVFFRSTSTSASASASASVTKQKNINFSQVVFATELAVALNLKKQMSRFITVAIIDFFAIVVISSDHPTRHNHIDVFSATG